MKRSTFLPSTLSLTFGASLFFGTVVPPIIVPDLLPNAEASSRDKRKIRKLKKQSRKLRRSVNSLRSQLLATRAQLPKPSIIEMVKVTDLGNPTDSGNASEANVYGSVNYEYSIGKFEVTLTQYTRFLNAVAATDTYELYNTSMGENLNNLGIERSGTDGSYTYAVIGTGDRPIAYVSWFDAARFCNWLHNGCPNGDQDETTTERGAYTLDGAIAFGTDISVNKGAKYWIPSEDEWYKAAYYQPTALGGDADEYWLYPTGSNSPPGNDIGPLPLANHANHNDGNDYSTTQSGDYDTDESYLTDGGSYGGSPGPYGTFDQGGNVREWTDTVSSGSFRIWRGGSWFHTEEDMRSSTRLEFQPDFESSTTGFRVASP